MRKNDRWSRPQQSYHPKGWGSYKEQGGDVNHTADIYLWECLHTETDSLCLARALPLSMYSQILGQHCSCQPSSLLSANTGHCVCSCQMHQLLGAESLAQLLVYSKHSATVRVIKRRQCKYSGMPCLQSHSITSPRIKGRMGDTSSLV